MGKPGAWFEGESLFRMKPTLQSHTGSSSAVPQPRCLGIIGAVCVSGLHKNNGYMWRIGKNAGRNQSLSSSLLGLYKNLREIWDLAGRSEIGGVVTRADNLMKTPSDVARSAGGMLLADWVVCHH